MESRLKKDKFPLYLLVRSGPNEHTRKVKAVASINNLLGKLANVQSISTLSFIFFFRVLYTSVGEILSRKEG